MDDKIRKVKINQAKQDIHILKGIMSRVTQCGYIWHRHQRSIKLKRAEIKSLGGK